MAKTPKAERPDKTAFEIMSRLVKQPPKTHDEMTAKPTKSRPAKRTTKAPTPKK